jgi:hypothetical protein
MDKATETNTIVQEVKDEVRAMPAGASAARLKRDWVRKSK